MTDAPCRDDGASPRRPRALLVYLLALLLTACSSVPLVSKGKREHSLEASVSTYEKLIRWGYFDEAARYVRAPEGTAQPTVDLARVARYRVTSYAVREQLLADNGKEARVIALIDYYDIDSGVLHKLRDEQYWWYDDAQKRWYLGSSLPAFGQSVAAP